MAAFTSKDPTEWAAFDAHWEKIMHDPSVFIHTIITEGQVAGFVLKYEMDRNAEIGIG